MTKKLITLAKAIREGEISEGAYIPYYPERKQCILKKEETGWKEDQKQETLDSLNWRLLITSQGKLVLVPHKLPPETIWLQGITGYHNGPNVANKVCEELYSYPRMGAVARCMTEDDLLRSMPEQLRKINRSCWLASHYDFVHKNSTAYCMRAVNVDSGTPYICNWYLAYSDCSEEDCGGLAVSPVIELPHDIGINITTRELFLPREILV